MRRVLSVVVLVLGLLLVGSSVLGLFTSPGVTVVQADPSDDAAVLESELRCDPLLGLGVPLSGTTVDLREFDSDVDLEDRREVDGGPWAVDAGDATTAVRCGDLRTRRLASSFLAGSLGLVLLLAVRPALRTVGEAFGREDYVAPDPDAPFRV